MPAMSLISAIDFASDWTLRLMISIVLFGATCALAAQDLDPAPHSLPERSSTKSITVFSSSIRGLVADCNLETGMTSAGVTVRRTVGLANAAAINAILATATAEKPVHLVIEAGIAIAAPLVIPKSGHVTIEGAGWDSGFYILPGSNCNAIQNSPNSDLSLDLTWSPPRPVKTAGYDITLSNFRINCNRGTYPNGNCDGHRDGTFTATSTPPADVAAPSDARGSFTHNFLLCGIVLSAVDNLSINKVWVYDAPTFHINLYHCTHVWIDRCRIEAGNPSFSGNTDGIHFNGGCSACSVTNCWASTGDDFVAINL
jgi:hypothetical protein